VKEGLVEGAEGGADDFVGGGIWGEVGGVEGFFYGFLGVGLFVAEGDEGEDGVVGVGDGAGGVFAGGFPSGGNADFVFEFKDDAFGGFFAEAGDFGEERDVVFDDGDFELVDAHAAEDGHGEFGADAGDAIEEEAEEVAFFIGGEAVEGVFVFADVEVGEDADLVAGFADGIDAGEGDEEFVSDAVDIDGDAIGEAMDEGSAEESDHVRSFKYEVLSGKS
jgi:hypothetical protein